MCSSSPSPDPARRGGDLAVAGGAYERARRSRRHGARGRGAGSYKVEPSRPQLEEIFLAPVRGFLRMAPIIALIFIVGGAFNILNDTGAIAAASTVGPAARRRAYLIIRSS